MPAPKGNKFALGLTTSGQPPKFNSPEELEKKCFEYFKHCIENKEKATITGLTLFVGFCSRSSWDHYKEKKEYLYIVKRANMTVQNSYELSGTTFDIFTLKNMGWKDKSEHDHNIKGELNYTTEERDKRIKDLLKKKDAE